MRYFVFRNTTIENLFNNFDTKYSSYVDIIVPDNDIDIYIWLYFIPVNTEPDIIPNQIKDYIQKIELIRKNLPAEKTFLICSLSDFSVFNFLNSNFEVIQAIHDFNTHINELSKLYSNIKIINISDFINKYSIDELIDFKFYYFSNNIINPKLSEDFAGWFAKKIDAINNIRKKCLVLDLDNTLWGGVLGEDGIEGIKLGNTYPGNAYSDFQKNLLMASKTGVILSICSKNNENDVLELWDKNPNMILKRNDFAAMEINWLDKATGIKNLSKKLNIGIDSMVFIDDSPIEREYVKFALPEIEVPDFPKQPYNLDKFFKDLYRNYFQTYSLTEEDTGKTQQYLLNNERESFFSRFESMDDYISNLDIILSIQPANEFNIQRIAQLSQKTNQFNLTTKRYTEADLKLIISKGNLVLALSVSDKFGDSGLTGLCIINFDKDIAEIDTFCLSCRILGRKIEFSFLDFILNFIKSKGLKIVNSTYIPTNKNQQVMEFYEKAGFILLKIDNDKKLYSLNLSDYNYFEKLNIKIKSNDK